MSEPLICLRDVFCVHRTAEGDAAALQGASLEVAAGELVCVLGPSGAGKSTLLSVIAGRQSPAAGTVCVAGRDIGRLPSRARARLRHELIGFMAQSPAAMLAEDLPARQAVALPLALRGVPRAQRRRRADELLEATGLRARAGSRPHELSGGERQRLALCAALAHRPALLLADEPTAELDAQAADTVHRAIVALARADATTVLMVSHDPATAALAQRVVQMADGRLAQDGQDGDGALIVDRGGWVRLPEGVLARAGIGDRVHVRAHDGQVVLTRVTRDRAAAPSPNGGPPPAPPATRARRSAAVVAVNGLSVTLGRAGARRAVLHEVTCAPAPGALTVVTGPSGSGKTTLLRALAGLVAPASGTVRIDDATLHTLNIEALATLRRDRIGYLPQDPVAVGFLSATETVALALQWRGWPAADAAARARALIDAVGLQERSRQRVSRLSAGEAQRVALARALAPAPGLVIVDEPTSRLDRAHARAVAQLLADTATRENQTIVCASHDPDVIAAAADTVTLGPTQ